MGPSKLVSKRYLTCAGAKLIFIETVVAKFTVGAFCVEKTVSAFASSRIAVTGFRDVDVIAAVAYFA